MRGTEVNVRRGHRQMAPTHHLEGESRYTGYLYIAPAVIVFGIFVLGPFIHSLYLSFFNWDGIGPSKFVGFANFREVWKNPILQSSFSHALILIFFYSVLPLLISLALVSVMNRGRIRGLTFYRTVLFLPYIVAPTAVAVIWRWILAPEGPLNTFLKFIGLGSISRGWIGDFTTALPSVGAVGTWVMFGLVLVMFIAGVQKIPTELYEATRIDGAGAFWEFWVVTLPGLKNEIVVALVLTVTAALRNFDVIYVMTSGGPGTSTVVPSYLVYQQAFVADEVGTAAAIGSYLILIIVLLNLVIVKLGARGK